ncbi:MAG TPA: hypothetical protein VFI65_17885 [Streptosporangiaceae bacterium]|nr:hypothetical protein [Streptosporangiaceae bacterium]
MPADQRGGASSLGDALAGTSAAQALEAPGLVAGNLEPGIRLLALAYPEFSIGQSGRGRHGPAWTVIRKDAAQPGLYAAVTPDLAELRAILARHASQQPDGSNPGS